MGQLFFLKGEVDNSSYPPVKVNFTALKKSLPTIEANSIKLGLSTLFETVQEVQLTFALESSQ